MKRITLLFIILIFCLSVMAFADSSDSEPKHNPPIGGNCIYFSTGEFYQEVTDLTIPGRGFPFRFTRKYRSYNSSTDGPLGYGWDFIYNKKIVKYADGTVDYFDGRGRFDLFQPGDNGKYIAPQGFYLELTEDTSSNTFRLVERDGMTYSFNQNPLDTAEYVLIRITDRNNNVMEFHYGDNPNLAEQQYVLLWVIDTLGRRINFSWGSLENLMVGVSDWTGRTVSFRYVIGYRRDLMQVIAPTGKMTSYGYGDPAGPFAHMMLSVKDPKGQVYLENTYDGNNFRVIRQKYGNGEFIFQYFDSIGTEPRKVKVTDRKGNLTEYWLTDQGNVSKEIKYTHGIRQGDPLSFTTNHEYNAATELVKTIFPNGNSIEYAYDITNPDPRARGNLLQVTRRTAQGATLTTQYTYEPLFNQVKTATDANGKVTTFIFDYEEGLSYFNQDLNGDGLYGASAQTHGNVIKIVYPTVTVGLAAGGGNQTSEAKFWYNDYGQLTCSIDPLGYVDTYEYYSSGPVNGYLYAIHRDINDKNITNTFEYDNVGNITGIYDGKNHKTAFTVNELNQVTQVTSRAPFSYQVKFDYDANDNLYHMQIQNIDKDGNPGSPTWLTTTFGYDILDNLTSKTEQVSDTENIVTGFTYDNNENRELITLPETNKVKNFYDERDFIYQVKRGYGSTDESTTTFNYDINGNRTQVVNGRGKLTIFTFDGFDRCTQITDALGNYAVIQYDANSNITQITRRNSSGVILSETKYLYDEMNRNYEVQQWLDTTSSWVSTKKQFDKNSRVAMVRDANNHDTKAYYDGLGRAYKTEDHLGNHVDYILDANSNVITRTEYEKTVTGTFVTFVTYTEHDNLDRPIRAISPIGVIRDCFYDSRSNPTYTIDGEGNTVANLYDGINRLLQVTRDMRQGGKGSGSIIDTIVTQYQWDKNSRLKFLIDDKNNTTGFAYDELNRRKKEIYPDLRYKEFFYDAEDNMYRLTDPNGNQIDNTFDDINRLTHRAITKGTNVIGVSSEDYGYDGLSRMNSASNDYSALTIGYDTMSRLLTEQQQIGGHSAKSIVSTYDSVGNRLSLTYPSNKVVNFDHDTIDRLWKVKDASQNIIAQYSYVGYRVEERNYFNNTKLTINYDGNARPITYSHTASGMIAGFAYAYDKEDNMLFEKRLHSTKGDAYVYDSIYRLTGVKYGVPNTELNPATPWANYATYDNKEDFTLDGANNWVDRTYNGSTTSYTSNILNQYTQISATNLTYDYNGNLKDDGTYLYAYDYANRLMQVKRKSDNVTIVDYQYDALGRRIEKANYLTLVTTNYYLDGARVIEERDVSDTVLATYTHGNGIDEILTMERNSQTYYYHENMQGSVYAVTNSSGNIVEKYEYTAYGKVTIKDGSGNTLSDSAIGNYYTYTGREYDIEFGLYYYRARYYSPDQGRFINRDPIADDDLMNLYAYAGNNSLNFTDPFGLETKQSSAGMTYATPRKPGYSEAYEIYDLMAEIEKKMPGTWKLNPAYYQSFEAHRLALLNAKTQEEVQALQGRTEQITGFIQHAMKGERGEIATFSVPLAPEKMLALREWEKKRAHMTQKERAINDMCYSFEDRNKILGDIISEAVQEGNEVAAYVTYAIPLPPIIAGIIGKIAPKVVPKIITKIAQSKPLSQFFSRVTGKPLRAYFRAEIGTVKGYGKLWHINIGGKGSGLPFNTHIHKYNWYNPFVWFNKIK